MTVTKTVSTNAKWIAYSGTYQEVINSLDLEGIPEHKVKGFAFVSTGACVAIVHKH